jgi:hypothetical protein
VRSAELELERAQIHAERARRQFDACESENRLVARTLEREWEQRLIAVRAAERALAEVSAKRPDPLTAEEIAWCRRAGADLRKVFDAPTTTDRERKQLLRAILADVIVTVDRTGDEHSAELRVVWEGGQVTPHTVALPRTGSHTRCTDQDTIELVRQLAQRYPDKQIAAILSRQGRLTGAGKLVHRPPRRWTARPPRDPRLPRPSHQRRWPAGHDRQRRQRARRVHRHRAPLAAGGVSSLASRSPPASPGRSGSPTSSASASASRRPTAGYRSRTRGSSAFHVGWGPGLSLPATR